MYSVSGKKRNTLSRRVDHVGLAHIFYLHLLKTFHFIPETLINNMIRTLAKLHRHSCSLEDGSVAKGEAYQRCDHLL